MARHKPAKPDTVYHGVDWATITDAEIVARYRIPPELVGEFRAFMLAKGRNPHIRVNGEPTPVRPLEP